MGAYVCSDHQAVVLRVAPDRDQMYAATQMASGPCWCRLSFGMLPELHETEKKHGLFHMAFVQGMQQQRTGKASHQPLSPPAGIKGCPSTHITKP